MKIKNVIANLRVGTCDGMKQSGFLFIDLNLKADSFAPDPDVYLLARYDGRQYKKRLPLK